MSKQKDKLKIRLPQHISPEHYKLTIQPDMEAFTFSGEELITVKLTKADKKIVLHSKEIEILGGWFQVGKEKQEISNITYQEKEETATLQFKKALPVGKGKLFLSFRGVISDKLRGFYRSQYEHLGETKNIATTQFESTDARRAFPCFDEPAHKAVFELSLIIPKQLNAISNTIESATPQGLPHDPNLKVVNFTPSPKMSTYLLAYIIGEFEFLETKTKSGVKVRVYTPKGRKSQGKFALDVAKRSLEFMNEYFDVPYPLPTLDLIAIPDFASGAMENWGAVTFRETALLVDEENTAFANKQRVAEVVAHELIHQWFGNLVTMEWWTYLWLNESFACLMAYLVVDELFPEWKFWTRFVLHEHSSALALDSLKNTHPIEVEVHHPEQISEIFDAISYAKGASVLRMLMNYIGPTHFRDGLRLYLKKHSYKNTSSIHLWEAFEKVSKKPVKKFMDPWLAKEGYPLLQIIESKPGKISIQQSRFTLQNLSNKITWPTPVQFQLSKEELSDINLITSKSKSVSINNSYEYIKTNPGETGFYRTIYSPQLLSKLYNPIKNKELSVTDRFGIIRDLYALVKAGKLPTSAYLEFLKAYKTEDSYMIWAEICSGMASTYNLAQDYPKLQEKLAKYFLQIMQPVVDLVGWTPEHKESNSRTMLRAMVLLQAGDFGNKEIISKAKSLFSNRKKKPISPDMRAMVYTLAGSKADNKTFSELKNMYIDTKFQEEQRRLGRGIMAVENPKVYAKSLDMLLSKSVRSQDATILIFWALNNISNRKAAWNWLKENWPEIQRRYHNDHLLIYAIEGLGQFASKKRSKEIEEFFKKNPAPSATRTIKQVLENINLKASWIERDKKDISNCLKNLK